MNKFQQDVLNNVTNSPKGVKSITKKVYDLHGNNIPGRQKTSTRNALSFLTEKGFIKKDFFGRYYR